MNILQSAKSSLFQQNAKIYQMYSDLTDILAFWRGRKQGYFSQNKEDLFLLEYFSGKTGTYIDVGAHHPFRYSNTYLLYKKGWQGINIEPMHSKYQKFVKARPRDTNLNVGVASSPGNLELYEMYPSVYSTFDRSVCQESINKNRAVLINSYEIPIQTMTEVCQKYLGSKTLDILSVDTEGFEMEVLKGFDWNQLKPQIIVIETNPRINSKDYGKDDVIEFLEAKGYKLIKQIKLNSILELTSK